MNLAPADLDPKRPVVWVTGASRGIGREVAREFAAIGCRVCLSGRLRNSLNNVVKEITALGGMARGFPCDVSKRSSIESAYRKIVQQVGPVDVLVNNAGITRFKSFIETTPAEFDAIIRTNLLGQIFCTKVVLPSMIKQKQGWIINIISYAAVKTFTNSSAYAASKEGMHGLGKVLRQELQSYNVKVVNVLPGATNTAMWKRNVRNKYGGRMMSPASIGEAVVKIFRFPPDLVVDEVILRPMLGDLD